MEHSTNIPFHRGISICTNTFSVYVRKCITPPVYDVCPGVVRSREHHQPGSTLEMNAPNFPSPLRSRFRRHDGKPHRHQKGATVRSSQLRGARLLLGTCILIKICPKQRAYPFVELHLRELHTSLPIILLQLTSWDIIRHTCSSGKRSEHSSMTAI